ncbi:hypothetical protein HDU83_005630 [Entophlyctis luteolus]|nr:hypothetical protein HDU83_005630 [Entophlyctis luteolus]
MWPVLARCATAGKQLKGVVAASAASVALQRPRAATDAHVHTCLTPRSTPWQRPALRQKQNSHSMQSTASSSYDHLLARIDRLFEHGNSPNLRKLLVVLSKHVFPPSDARKAIHIVLKRTSNWSIDSRFLHHWIYVLVFRQRIPAAHVWRMIETLERQSSATAPRKYLNPKCLRILVEAELRGAENRFRFPSVKSTTSPPSSQQSLQLFAESVGESDNSYGNPLRRYRSSFDYIEKSGLPLSTEHCEAMMKEFASFESADGAMRLFHLMKSCGLIPNLFIYECLMVAVTRKHRVTNDAIVVLEDMTECGVYPSVRIYNSLMRWSFEFGLESEDMGVMKWAQLMLEKGVTPNLTTVTILTQFALTDGTPGAVDGYVDEKLVKLIGISVKSVADAANLYPISEGLKQSDLADIFVNLISTHTRPDESHAAFVVINAFYIAKGELDKAFATLSKVRELELGPSTRLYGDLMRAAIVSRNSELLDKITHSMSIDRILPDRYIYQQLIKAEIAKGDLDSAIKIFDSWLFLENPTTRKNALGIDDMIMTDLIVELGNLGEYELIFTFYKRFRENFELGPRFAAKIISLTAPISGQEMYDEDPVLMDVLTEKSKVVDQQQSSLANEISKSLPNTRSQLPSSPRESTFYPPYSLHELLDHYTNQSQEAHIDTALCTAAITALILSKESTSKTVQQTVLDLFARLESCGAQIDAPLLASTGEAFARTRNMDGINWVLRLMRQLSVSNRGNDETTGERFAMRDAWRRLWMAATETASRCGDVEGTERAVRGLCGALVGHDADIDVAISALHGQNRARILRAIDALLAVQARARNADGVCKVLTAMKSNDAVPSFKTLKILYFRDFQDTVDDIMGQKGWLLDSLSLYLKDKIQKRE